MSLKSYVVNRKSVAFSVLLIVVLGVLFFEGSKSQNLVQSFLKLVNIKNESGDQGQTSAISFSGERYTNSQFNFSFEKPKGFTIGEFEEGESHVVIVQSKEGKGGFQILITPLGAPDVEIIKEIITTEIPDIKIENEHKISIGNASGLEFESDNPSFGGDNIETWFMYKGNIYQISGYKETIPIIEAIINTWKWF